MKDFNELVLSRQSCRNFNGKEVDKEALLKCLDAARLAPSACNSQPWHFVVVTESKTKEKLAKMLQIIGGNIFADKAPALIAVCEDACPKLMSRVLEKWDCRHFAQGDLGLAVAHLILQAADLGLATCIMGTFDDADVKELLGVPEENTVRVIVALGHASDTIIREKNRKTLEEVVRFVE